MSHRGILIVYGSQHGQAAKIALRIAERLRRQGDEEVTVLCGDDLPLGLALDGYSGVVVGASVRFGRHQRYIERFVREHARELAVKPSVFFSVSGSGAGKSTAERREAEAAVSRFLAATGWRALEVATFGGAIAYTKYGAVTRWLMRSLARRKGVSTDISRDHELTDWRAVERFADRFLALLPSSQRVVAKAG
jgi:menaquinone-dependent protoporphyrinogen oxidase